MRSYLELITIPTFEERFEYLKISGHVGVATFGHDRYLNQIFYNSDEWKAVRNAVIIRDGGCDLVMPDREILSNIIVHHINPITVDDVINRRPCLFDMNNLVCVTHNTHEAIHYSDASRLIILPKERTPFDTCPWRC